MVAALSPRRSIPRRRHFAGLRLSFHSCRFAPLLCARRWCMGAASQWGEAGRDGDCGQVVVDQLYLPWWWAQRGAGVGAGGRGRAGGHERTREGAGGDGRGCGCGRGSGRPWRCRPTAEAASCTAEEGQ